MEISQKTKYGLIVGIVILLIGCYIAFPSQEKTVDVEKVKGYNPDSIAMMETYDVTTLISDSGIVRYRIMADAWLVYDKMQDPHWLFPKGVYFEQFDTLFNVIATVEADSAWNYTRRRVWKLRGNVVIENSEGVIFKSQEFFWNQLDQKVYSREQVHIDQPGKGKLIALEGFESNEQMTEYEFTKMGDSTEIYVKDNNEEKTEKKE